MIQRSITVLQFLIFDSCQNRTVTPIAATCSRLDQFCIVAFCTVAFRPVPFQSRQKANNFFAMVA